MAHDVMVRKISRLRQLLTDFEAHRNATLEDVKDNHYEIEWLLVLIVTTACDLLFHLLSEQDIVAESYKDAFVKSGRHGIIPVPLSIRMQGAAGLRNRLVHLYDEIEYEKIHSYIPSTLKDFEEFIQHFVSVMDRDRESRG